MSNFDELKSIMDEADCIGITVITEHATDERRNTEINRLFLIIDEIAHISDDDVLCFEIGGDDYTITADEINAGIIKDNKFILQKAVIEFYSNTLMSLGR